MKCDDAMQQFLQMDNRDSLPFFLRIHVWHCRRCKEEIDSLQQAYIALLDAAPYELPRDLSGPLYDEIAKQCPSYRREMSYTRWLVVGFILIASRIAVTFSDTLVVLQGHYGGRLDIPLNIVLGLVMSIYAALFIGTHIEELKKLVRLYVKWL